MYNHYTYGNLLATNLRAISHTDQKKKYFLATENTAPAELFQQITNASGMILIAVDGVESEFIFPNSDSLVECPIYSFVILQNAETGNPVSINKAQTECKSSAIKIISRMIQDYHNGRHGLRNLLPSTFVMKGVGPIAENFHGVIITFSLNNPTNYHLNKEDWHE